MALHCITFHCIALHDISLLLIAMHCIALHYIAFYGITLHCIRFHCIALHYISLLSITHCITLHCMALHCITSHCIPFHCITLHLCGATMHLCGANTICIIIESGVGGRGREPFNPGAGPAPVSSPEAFGGNRRLYTLAAPAADHLVLTSCRFRFAGPGAVPCNLQCILRVVFRNHRFLQGFVAFAVSRFHLGDVKKPWVFHAFGSLGGVRNGNLDILTALVST